MTRFPVLCFFLASLLLCQSLAWGQVIANAAMLQPNQFENWAFSGQTEAAVKKRLQSKYEQEIKKMNQICKLSESQLDKLRLAGQGDISRFFRQVEEARKKSENLNQNDQQQAQQLAQLVSPIQIKLNNGIFLDDSLFKKVCNQSLSEEQQKALEEHESAGRELQVRVMVQLRIVRLERQVPLLSVQRQGLVDLVTKTIGGKKIPKNQLNNIADIALSAIPDDKLAKILDQHQISALRKSLQNADAARRQLENMGIKIEE